MWNLSKNLTNFDPHRHSNNRQYVVLATRPGWYKWLWSRQCGSVEKGMFLLSARRVELEVRSDHDKRNPLPLTKGHCWLLRHLLFRLLVETFPRFLDGLFFLIFTPYSLVPPQSGFSDSIIPSGQFCCSICYCEYEFIFLFVLSILLSRWFFEGRISDASMSSQRLNVCSHKYLLAKFLPRTVHAYQVQHFLTQLVEPWLALRRNRMIFNHDTKRNYRACTWFSQPSFMRSFPICQKVLDISSQINNSMP